LPHEEDGDGFADDIARADDDGPLAAYRGFGGFDHLEDSQGGARDEGRLAVDDVSDVGGVDTLNIFLGGDEALDLVGVYPLGKGQVDHDGRRVRLRIQKENAAGDVVVPGIGREGVELVGDTQGVAGFALVFGVLAGGIVAGIDDKGIEPDGAGEQAGAGFNG